jgi:hypothetical protein
MSWYQYEMFSSNIATTIRTALVDPDSCTAEALFNAVHGGNVASPLLTHNWIGWVNRPLNDLGLSHIKWCLAQDWVTFGIREENDIEGAHAYGFDGDDAPYLTVWYIAPNEPDIQAVRAALPTWPVIAGTSDTALLVLTNNGLHASDPFWAFATSQGLGRESALVEAVAVGETVSVQLPIPLPSQGKGFVDYDLWSGCPNDPWHVNDTAAFTCWVFPRGTYAIESFEQPSFPPPGWATADNDTGRQCWERRAGDGLQHSGDAYAFCKRENGWSFNDDWLMTGPVYPSSGYRDSVGVCYRSHEYPTLLGLQVWALDGQTVSDTVSILARVDVTDSAYHWRTVSLDRFDGNAVYVGFRNTSGGGQTFEGLCLDDIWFSRVPIPGTCEPQTSLARRSELALAPNPATGRFVMARYDIAVGSRGDLTLRNVLGRTVKSFVLDPSGDTRLDLRGFAPGVYIANLRTTGQSVSRKLVITEH